MSNAAVPPPQRVQKDNTSTCLIVGCSVFAIGAVALVGLVALGGYFLFNTATQMIANVSSEEPLTFPASTVGEEEFVALQGRYDAFVQAIETGAPAEPLRLSIDEINALLQRGLAGGELADSMYATIVDDKIQAEFSFPIEKFLPLEQFKGRFINGTGTLDVYTRNGQLFAHLLDVRIGDTPLPAEMADAMSRENLVKGMMDDPKAREVIQRIASIEVADGAVLVTPADTGTP